MKEQMNQGVSREECEELADRKRCPGATYLEARLARAHLALLDECENLRKDKERLDWLESDLDDLSVLRDLSTGKSVQISWCSPATGCPLEERVSSVREAIDTAISENAANAPQGESKCSET